MYKLMETFIITILTSMPTVSSIFTKPNVEGYRERGKVYGDIWGR